jgi:hypothetical protein
MKIIQNNEIWLRNARGMNDYSEVEHGFQSFREALIESDEGKSFQKYITSNLPNVLDTLIKNFDGWLPSIRQQTYLACLSEHENSDDDHGRLSMWRAYGGKKSVALIFNSKPFTNDTDALETKFYPVTYRNSDYVRQYLHDLETRMREKNDIVRTMDSGELLSWLFELCKMMVLCVKHPGFREEREWRLVYSPEYEKSPHVLGSIESIDGVPQQVYKIRFQNMPDKNLTNATLPECLDRVIIGPSDDAPLLIDSFKKMLTEAGVQNASEKVFYSGIPLR